MTPDVPISYYEKWRLQSGELREAKQRIAELEAIIIAADAAYNIDRQPAGIESASIALVRMCHEGRAAMDELAAVPKWTRITDDPATWPPDVRMVDVLWWDGERPHLTTSAILRHRAAYMPTRGAWLLAQPEAEQP